MTFLHPNLTHQLRQWAHRVGQAAVPDDATLRGDRDTLMTDSTATPTTGREQTGSGELLWLAVDGLLAITLVTLLGMLVGGML